MSEPGVQQADDPTKKDRGGAPQTEGMEVAGDSPSKGPKRKPDSTS